MLRALRPQGRVCTAQSSGHTQKFKSDQNSHTHWSVDCLTLLSRGWSRVAMAQTVWPANPNPQLLGPCMQSWWSPLRATCGPAVPTAFSQSSPQGQGLPRGPVRCQLSPSLPATGRTGPRRGAQTSWAGAWLLTPGPTLYGQFFVYDAILPSAACTEPPAFPQPG